MDGGDLSLEHKLAFDGCLEIRVLFKGPDVLKKLCDGTKFPIDWNDDDIGATQVDRAHDKIPEVKSNKPNTAKFLHLKGWEDNARG
nr:hypothetical protein [Tanacetum cinerariifolium]